MNNLSKNNTSYYKARLSSKSVLGFLVEGNSISIAFFHVIIGISCLFSSYFLIFWFYCLIINYFSSPFNIQQKYLPHLLGYLIPIELLGRIVLAYPLIPTELGKYFGAIILIYGILFLCEIKKGKAGILMLILSLPSLLLVPVNFEAYRYGIIFSYLGFFVFTLSVIFFSNFSCSKDEVGKIFRTIAVGGIPIIVFVIVKSPEISSTAFELTANNDFTGNYGSNQVSTILGLLFGISAFLWITDLKIFKNNILNLSMIMLPLVWAILSFSRGGVISSLLSIILIFILTPNLSKRTIDIKIYFKWLLIVGLVVGVFLTLNEITDNKLLLRYQGETKGTLIGSKEKDLNHLTTGRLEVALSDIRIWTDNVILGVGPGESNKMRKDYGLDRDVAPHFEVTRLMAEHGIFGVIIAIVYLLIPFKRFFQSKNHPFLRAFIIFCFTVAILSSFHSAMRTFVTPFLYGMGCIKIYKSN